MALAALQRGPHNPGVASIDALVKDLLEGNLDIPSLLGLNEASVNALVEHALRAAEFGQLDQGLRLLDALTAGIPSSPTLPFMAGHIAAQKGDTAKALAYYQQAKQRTKDPMLLDKFTNAINALGPRGDQQDV